MQRIPHARSSGRNLPIFYGTSRQEIVLGDGMPLLAGTVTIDDTTLDLPLSLSDTQSSLDAALDITVAWGDTSG